MADLGYDCLVQQKPHEVKLAVFWRCSAISLTWSEERSRAILAEMTLLNTNTNTNTNTNNSTNYSSSTVYIINVHLEGSPYRAADRVSQLRHALQRLAHHLESTGRDISTAKVILVGDLNSISTDSPSKFLKEGKLEAGYTDPRPPNQQPATEHDIQHPFKLHDVYEKAQQVPAFTRKVEHRTGARLDFVWATPGLDIEAVMRPLPMEHRELVERVGLPNYALPSDHLPVGAVFRFVEEEEEEEVGNAAEREFNGGIRNRVSVDSGTNNTSTSESDEQTVPKEDEGGGGDGSNLVAAKAVTS